MAGHDPKLFLVTGVMAAGKSTVGQALAERFDRGVHVRGDWFRRSIVAGRVDMSPAPSDEALAQLRLRYELAVSCAQRYRDAGFTTVLQDTIIGPMLTEVVDMFHTSPVVIVLAPSVEEIARREHGRPKTGYEHFTPADLDAVLREETPNVGLWVDSTDLSVEETVDVILARS